MSSTSSGRSMPDDIARKDYDVIRMSLPPDFTIQNELKKRHTKKRRDSSGSSKTAPSFALDEEKGQVSLFKDIQTTKSFLMQCGDTGISIWTHLSELLKRIVEERPTNVIDYFEEYSRRLKAERFATVNQHLRDEYIPHSNLESAKRKISLLKSLTHDVQEYGEEEEQPEAAGGGEGEEEAGVGGGRKVGFLERMNFFRECGIGLSLDETYAINVAIRRLTQIEPLKSVRFWGKILGLKHDYIVAECELTDEELNRRLEAQLTEEQRQEEEANEAAIKENEENEKAILEAMTGDKNEEGEQEESEFPVIVPLRDLYKMPEIPLPPIIEEKVIPNERYGEGVNKKLYFVCNNPGEEWVQLPNVTPKIIIASRKIKKYFTGDLNHCIVSFPEFPGAEKDYLRAQIARISAATQISPLGYYIFHEPAEEEEEPPEEEEEETKSTFIENTEFEPLPIKDLTDSTLAFWVHHSQHILKQGRTKFWSSKELKGEEEGGDEEGGEEEDVVEPEVPEMGPPLLTPLSEDVSLEMTSPWTVQNTTTFTPENAIAVVSSNLWPGAFAFATGKIFGNIYIGFGHKYSASGFSPMPLPFPEEEYIIGPEVMEIDDPTTEMEEAWRLAHEPPKSPLKGEGEDEEEEEEEEGGGGDDDD